METNDISKISLCPNCNKANLIVKGEVKKSLILHEVNLSVNAICKDCNYNFTIAFSNFSIIPF